MPRQERTFKASKRLAERDNTIIDMLNSAGHEDVSFCVCDHEKPDCPIIFASEGFCTLTGYDHTEIEGRNCRYVEESESSWRIPVESSELFSFKQPEQLIKLLAKGFSRVPRRGRRTWIAYGVLSNPSLRRR